MEKNSDYPIIFYRRKIECIQPLFLAVPLLICFFIDETSLRYLWLLGVLVSMGFVFVYLSRPTQIITMSKKDLCTEYGDKKRCFGWDEIIAVHFKQIPSTWESVASGPRCPSNSFKIISTSGESMPLKSRGWHLKIGLDSNEVKAAVPYQAKPIYDSDKIHLIFAFIEKKTGIKPSLGQMR
jgi:hypothetical protein